MNGRQRVLAFLKGEPVDRLPLMPVVMMFCADHIGVKYGRYVKECDVLAEAQIRTAEDYQLDCVSCMSDPAREASDFGAKIEWYEDQPAAIVESEALLADKAQLARLPPADPLGGGRMHAAVQSLEIMRRRAGQDKVVMGWVEGPCAEAADLRGINTLMVDFYDDPQFVEELFEFVVDNALRYARAQVEAGADIIGIGDAAASLISRKFYQQYVWPYEQKLVDGLHQLGALVRLHICGDTRHLLEAMAQLGCEIVDLDFLVPLERARAVMGPDQVLLGNIDPVRVLRDGSPASIRAALQQCRRQAGPRYIVGAGCEVTRDTAPANVRAMLEFASQAALD